MPSRVRYRQALPNCPIIVAKSGALGMIRAMERNDLIARRDLLAAGLAAPLLAAIPAQAQRMRASNPLIRQRADPQIIRVGGWFYFMGSVPEYDRLALRRARTVAGLATAPETVVWRRPAEGKLGGYMLARAPEEIQIGHVVRVLDGPLAPIPCASKTRYQPCDDCDVATCQIRHMMLDVRNAIAEVLDKTSLAQLRDSAGDMLGDEDVKLPA